MNFGAIVVALFGLGVGTGALWFAWRLVRAAGGEGEAVDAAGRATGESQSSSEQDIAGEKEREPHANAHAPPSALGQIGAVLAFGGICLLLPAFINIADLWHLAAAGLATSLLGFVILMVTRRRRRRPPASEQP